MKTFGNHLGSNEDIDLACTKRAQSLAIRIFPAHRISVHPADDGMGKDVGNVSFDLLRSEADIDQGVL